MYTHTLPHTCLLPTDTEVDSRVHTMPLNSPSCEIKLFRDVQQRRNVDYG